MNYFFNELYRSFSLLQVHDGAVKKGWTDLYKMVLTPFLIFILILIIREKYIWYIILFPWIVLFTYYSYGDIDDFVDYTQSSDIDEENLTYEVSTITEDPVRVNPIDTELPPQVAFIYGTIFSFFLLSYPNICFTLEKKEEDKIFGTIKVLCISGSVKITISDTVKQYQFVLEENVVTDYDKEILSLFFQHSRVSNFVISTETITI